MRARGGSSRFGPSRGGTSPRAVKRGDGYRGRGRGRGVSNERREPNHVIDVPMEYRRETKAAERRRIVSTWLEETGCEVVPQPLPYEGSGQSVITRFELFGTTEKLNKATHKIGEWIRYSATKTSETTKWAKLSAHNPKTWFQDRMQREQDDRKKKFLRDMPAEEATIYKSLVRLFYREHGACALTILILADHHQLAAGPLRFRTNNEGRVRGWPRKAGCDQDG